MPRGGARRGAGRPKGSKNKKPFLLNDDNDNIINDSDSDPSIRLMEKVVNNPSIDVSVRLDAAKSLAQYRVARYGVRSASDASSSVEPITVVVSQIPHGHFVTEEEARRLASLPCELCAPPLDEVVDAEVRGPRSARVYTPPIRSGIHTTSADAIRLVTDNIEDGAA